MEVEAGWSAILHANSYSPALGNWRTSDYVKLLVPLHLSEYEVGLTSYPGLPPLAPFAGWDTRHPTQSLAWYYAYNQTKHNRERHFDTGTPRHAIDAVAASAILFFSQFGTAGGFVVEGATIHRISGRQKWPHFPAEEWYIIQPDSGGWEVPVIIRAKQQPLLQ